jgi:RNA polymerase sigma-70 factor (ECF subfamily)
VPVPIDQEAEVSDALHPNETAFLLRLRSGDEAAFARLVDELHGRLLGLAGTFTNSASLAEDIVQETWLGVIRGLHGFEERSSLRTWIFNILVRRARTLVAREARRAAATVPLEQPDPDGNHVEWEPGNGRIGLWEETPVSWGLVDPATFLQMRDTLDIVERALASLPAMQRQVVLLRDVEDLTSTDVCNILGVSETNQRVLLHRGRARIRRALDQHVRGGVDRHVRTRACPAPIAALRSALSPGGLADTRREA